MLCLLILPKIFVVARPILVIIAAQDQYEGSL